MLFNSYIFLFLFLPLTVLVYHGLRRYGNSNAPALFWLVLMSLFYYGWWEPRYLLLLGASIAVNYLLGLQLASHAGTHAGRWITAAGISANLATLGYFKYANFFFDSLNHLTGSDLMLAPVLLPLAISFFTFQQIAYLVDSYRGEVRERNFLHYCLFVCFFPQLLSGPIVHHREMMPQFAAVSGLQDRRLFAQGLTLLAIGLFKKVILADSLALYSNLVFATAEAGANLSAADALLGSLAFTLQLYFDFSGYCDIAVGVAALFGIRLIFNFASPFQSLSIIDFWRRWHISLSTFLRDYLYLPLGGNRRGSFMRYSNLMITMVLGGLWHGAGWNFVIWGTIHGALLIGNHSWRHLLLQLRWEPQHALPYRLLCWFLCFTAVTLAFVVFHAQTMQGAGTILQAMFTNDWSISSKVTGNNGVSPLLDLLGHWLPGNLMLVSLLILSLALTMLFPNSQTLVGLEDNPRDPLLDTRCYRLRWKANPGWAIAAAVLLAMSLLTLGSTSEFVYFQF